MTHKFIKAFLLLPFLFCGASAQNKTGYTVPPKEISDILLAKPSPVASPNDKGDWLLFTTTSLYPSVEELARPEFRIAGLRINPNNFGPSRQNFITDIYLEQTAGKEYRIEGLPSPLAASDVSWSPAGTKIAFLQTTANRIDLYIIDLATKHASRINKAALDVVLEGYTWVNESTLLYQTIVHSASAVPARPLMPAGPTTQENYGKASPRPTFQDMIKSPYDEQVFEFLATAQLVQNINGNETPFGHQGLYASYSPSPDKKFILLKEIRKPFSYLVPAQGFPSTVSIIDTKGKLIKELAALPSSETAPSGNDNVMPVPRGFDWRDDEAATITWCQPLDSGLIKKTMDYHDAVYELSAPFTDQEKLLFKTAMRYRGTAWGNANLALVYQGLTGRQRAAIYQYSPATGKIESLFERNTTDAYSNPGTPVTAKNQFGRDAILLTDNNNRILFNNPVGSSPKGDLPFLSSVDLATRKTDILWRCPEGYFETVVQVVDAQKMILLTRKESEKEVPNYWLRNISNNDAKQLSFFKSPYPALEGVSKQKIFYKRADGVALTGDLYLPKGYNQQRDGKLPVFIWAYPAEYNSAADAAQVRGSEHRFTMVTWGSPVFYVTQGYAVLNNAEMPVVATSSDKRPNDDFVEQLTMNANAAINALDSMGVGDKNRMAVGGHSYGAFMTANLLAHTSLFKAGIARSGAYNRTLTPFGFQNEDRTYWQAPDLYHDMSPFSYADKIKTPILMIHGELDDNTGTYPIQSERMFNAIKGQGGTVKYISLPFEAHGYRGRENILHMLNEQLQWLNKYVKNADKTSANTDKKAF